LGSEDDPEDRIMSKRMEHLVFRRKMFRAEVVLVLVMNFTLYSHLLISHPSYSTKGKASPDIMNLPMIRLPQMKNWKPILYTVEDVNDGKGIFDSMQEDAILSRDVSFRNVVDVCVEEEEVCIIFVILSARNYAAQRAMIRDTWLLDSPAKCAKHVFVLGTPKEGEPFVNVTRESEIHGDIIVGDFEESYTSLVYKVLLGFKYATTYCSKAKFVVKVDDDVFVDVQRLYEFLGTKDLCQGHDRSLIDRKVERTYEMEHLDGSSYKTEGNLMHLGGPIYIGTMDFARAAQEVVPTVNFSSIEDIFFTHKIAKLVNATLVTVDADVVTFEAHRWDARRYDGQLAVELEPLDIETRRMFFLEFECKVRGMQELLLKVQYW
jgi:beta-1,3-galactosyltransferase 1